MSWSARLPFIDIDDLSGAGGDLNQRDRYSDNGTGGKGLSLCRPDHTFTPLLG